MNVAIAAPVTPNARPVPQPKINTGASTMFRMTVAVCTIIPGLKFPVPRSDAPIAMSRNCSAIPGIIQSR
jgi:hypothetical protein